MIKLLQHVVLATAVCSLLSAYSAYPAERIDLGAYSVLFPKGEGWSMRREKYGVIFTRKVVGTDGLWIRQTQLTVARFVRRTELKSEQIEAKMARGFDNLLLDAIKKKGGKIEKAERGRTVRGNQRWYWGHFILRDEQGNLTFIAHYQHFFKTSTYLVEIIDKCPVRACRNIGLDLSLLFETIGSLEIKE